MDSVVIAPIDNPEGASRTAHQRVLEIRFTGSGSEYFRIWSVNLLLILVSLGLYYPFAKARRIRYFYANTLVDGQALSFHGDPWKMFRGFVLLVVLMAVYSLARYLWPAAAVPALVVLCAVWPVLWRASMQFRLSNTAWRGLRMGFSGSLKNAYLALTPFYLPLIAFVALSQWMIPAAADAAAAEPAAGPQFSGWVFAPMALMLLAGPWAMALIKRYQHGGYRLANQQCQMALPAGRLYVLALKALFLTIVFAVGAAILIGVVFGAVFGGSAAAVGGHSEGMKPWAGLVGGAIGLLAYAAYFVVIGPFLACRMQNLVWDATRSQSVQFHSRLSFKPLLWLTLKNWSLVALTLSLYRPFAAVNTARMRLEAVSLSLDGDLATWAAPSAQGLADASGEIAGDFFGIDMGL